MCAMTETQKDDPHRPQSFRKTPQSQAIEIHLFRAFKHLQVSEHVKHDKSEENNAGDRHDGFFAVRRSPETHAADPACVQYGS